MLTKILIRFQVRELEADPFLIIASSISKAERYGGGAKDQVESRLHSRPIFDTLLGKPADYWQGLLKAYFVDDKTFVTKVLPKVRKSQTLII